MDSGEGQLASDPPRIEFREASLDEFSLLATRGYRLYVILDALDSPVVKARLLDLGNTRASSLYEIKPQGFRTGDPYLCEADPALLSWIRENLWDKPWGIAVVSTADREDVAAHLRRFAIVRSETGEDFYFRFYDPRALPVFLQTSGEREVREFFGPIQAYAVHQPDAPNLRIMRVIEE